MRQKYEYDAFISHAVEDKIPIANELCAKLERAGLRVWYSGKELGIGDSIEKTIEKGLNRSRYGIVVFSPTYLAKNWTIREFYTLLAKEIKEHKVILPVLYNVTPEELKNKDLLMADRFAVNADRGIDFVVDKLVHEIKKPKVAERKLAWLSRIWLVLIVSLLANVAFLLNGTVFTPHDPSAEAQNQYSAVSHQELTEYDLVGQMEHIAETLNGCTCFRKKKLSTPVINVSHPYNDGDEAGPYALGTQTLYAGEAKRRPARKMTMAVVFQIEAEQEPTHLAADDESNGIFQAVSDRPREQRDFSATRQADGNCSHTYHEAH